MTVSVDDNSRRVKNGSSRLALPEPLGVVLHSLDELDKLL